MALSFLHTTLLLFLQRSVWHSLFPFFIFQFFVFYMRAIFGRRQEVSRRHQEVSSRQQEVSRRQEEVSRRQEEVSARHQEVSARQQEVSARQQEVSSRQQEVVGSIPTIQRNAKNMLSYITTHLFINDLILSK